jgi:RNA polymerase sigma-70 factor, ECF subfamily
LKVVSTPEPPPADENRVLEQVLAGDVEAFAYFVRTYQRRVYGMALRFLRDTGEAECVAQEAFLKAYQALADFRGGSTFETWITRITINKCRDRLKRKRLVVYFHQAATHDADREELEDQIPSPEPTPERLLHAKEIQARLREAIGELSPRQRTVFVLKHLEEPDDRERPARKASAPEDFFLLVLPPAGDPEALPPHLSGCAPCARQFAQWRAAAEGLAASPEDPPADFERKVMAQIRSKRPPRSRRSARRSIAGLLSAACLLAAFWLGTRIGGQPKHSSQEATIASMSEADRADDELLRDVSRLVSSDDETSWKSLAPLPSATGGNS